MLLLRLGLASGVIVGGWVALPYVDTPLHRAESLAALKRTVNLSPEPPHITTVYQSTGSKGEVAFSDAHHDQGRGQARIVDNSKGNSFHTVLPQSVDEPPQGGIRQSTVQQSGTGKSGATGVGSSPHYAQGNDPIAKLQREQLKFQLQAADLKKKQMDQIIGD